MRTSLIVLFVNYTEVMKSGKINYVSIDVLWDANYILVFLC